MKKIVRSLMLVLAVVQTTSAHASENTTQTNIEVQAHFETTMQKLNTMAKQVARESSSADERKEFLRLTQAAVLEMTADQKLEFIESTQAALAAASTDSKKRADAEMIRSGWGSIAMMVGLVGTLATGSKYTKAIGVAGISYAVYQLFISRNIQTYSSENINELKLALADLKLSVKNEKKAANL